mgnify:CR=1 FL=1
MSDLWIESVPNISEGRNRTIIDAIVDAARGFDDSAVLSAEPDADYNRTVITIAGSPDSVLEATISLIGKAAELIDMRQHEGAHPRMGAVDVCPFVPLSEGSHEACMRSVNSVLAEFGDTLPIYLYGDAATSEGRRSLAKLRRGEFEGLRDRLNEGDWADEETRMPDRWSGAWGEREQRFGAMAVGVRPVLVAYNINVNETEPVASKAAASLIRSTGRLVKGPNGQKLRIYGMLDKVQGMGVSIPSHGISQVSMNLQDVYTTPMHKAYEAVKSVCADLGVEVCGSELVGLVPLSAMLESGRWYHLDPDAASDDELVSSAVAGLGLDRLEQFDAYSSIIEWSLNRNLGGD